MTFTNTDKALIDRAARHLKSRAVNLAAAYSANWADTPQSKAAKKEYDRLLRDERDLRTLGKRMVEGVHGDKNPVPSAGQPLGAIGEYNGGRGTATHL